MSATSGQETEPLSRPDLVRKLLKGIETGDPEAASVVHPTTYIQHNPQTQEGGPGLAELFARISKSNPRVNVVRAFEDGDYVFGHTEYDFSTRRIGFEVFRFEGSHAVEHWDNIQPRKGPNPSGHSMVDGPTEASDLDQTEANRNFVRSFVEEVLIKRDFEKMLDYVTDDDSFVQHSPHLSDSVEEWRRYLAQPSTTGADDDDTKHVQYDRIHRVLARGNYVLVVSEGSRDGVHTSFYDLFRVQSKPEASSEVENRKIVEHWDTVEAVPPESEWKNDNGKF
eukprot:CAMPEP_0194039516 /NCGR_PEP_ID=MMETSP0009_2-20130614/11637_1 /TAXON_ID=210454 /ORGANISM="Grammatophora oceanica, Strain CCMP 410" /LENGTH=280 /DNA_ID=CAMNT_0038682379 /DNA_START=127 /DNA_END=969 /DNA_ORIENTATION=+